MRFAARVAEGLITYGFRKLETVKKLSKLHRILTQYPVLPPAPQKKQKYLLIPAKNCSKIEIKTFSFQSFRYFT